MSSQWKEEAQHVKGYLLEITYKDLMKVSLWFMDVKCTLVTYGFGEFRLSRSHFPCAVSLNRDFSSVILITFMNGWLGFFFFFRKKEICCSDFFLPLLFLLLASNQCSIAFLMPSSGSCWKLDTLQGIRLNFFHYCPFISAHKWAQIIKIMFPE